MSEIEKGDTVYLEDDYFNPNQRFIPKKYKGIKTPKKNELYTVRELVKTDFGTGILLEEIRNELIPHTYGGLKEPCFRISRFRKKESS